MFKYGVPLGGQEETGENRGNMGKQEIQGEKGGKRKQTNRRYTVTNRRYTVTNRSHTVTNRRHTVTIRSHTVTNRRYIVTNRRYTVKKTGDT